jgi:hypothetical protein
LADQVAGELISQFVKNLGGAVIERLQDGDSLDELQSLLADLIEEVKVNYIQHLESPMVDALPATQS